MRLKQFFSYFGSKSSLAKQYPAPKFNKIIEPFAGSAAYACEYHESEVNLYEKDPVVFGIWQFLIGASEKDILNLPLSPEGVRDLPESQQHFIGFWYKRGGVTPGRTMNAWGRSGKYPYSFWSPQTRARIAGQVERIAHWKVFNVSYESIPLEEATWFVDPPYASMGHRYRFGSKGLNYGHLANWCKYLPGQVIVCEESRADWLPFAPLYQTRNCRNNKYTEGVFLATNDPSVGPFNFGSHCRVWWE